MGPDGSAAPARGVFERLHRRLTAVFALIALTGFVVFVTVLSVLDARFDRARVDAILRGEASRAAAFVFEGDDGAPSPAALRGDHVTRQATGLLVVARQKEGFTTVFSDGRTIDGDWSELARRCVEDESNSGTHADIGSVRVAGMPWWLRQSDPEPMGCALTLAPRRAAWEAGVAVPAAIGSLALLLVLTGLVWWVSGRSLGVAARALGDRERFLATAAHEMRGPLARMRAVAESALRTLAPGQSETAGQLRSLVATADSAGRVAANLLLASRIDHAEVPVRMEPVQLADLACEVETSIGGVVVDVTETVTVLGDAMLLRQAMTNLVDNAQRHGRQGADASEVLLTVMRREGQAVVRVADDGPGFPEGLDVLAPFVSGATGGNGLGLPLVRWISSRHGAQLWHGPAGGQDGLSGAAVEIRFPRDRQH